MSDVQYVAYAVYVEEWMGCHDEGCPVCMGEFIMNEYRECVDEMIELFQKYDLEHWIPVYMTDINWEE